MREKYYYKNYAFQNLRYPTTIRYIMDHCIVERCNKVEIDGPYIDDQLDYHMTFWRSESPIAIEGKTGCGKTTFVCEKIVKPSSKANYNVLIITNRSSLNIAYKKALPKYLVLTVYILMRDCKKRKNLKMHM